MTDPNANSTNAVPDAGTLALPKRKRERGYAMQVVREALVRTGARLGLAWILVLVVCAVFAPFIASSHPLAMSVDGEVSSPALRHLHWVDVTLVVAFFTAIIFWFLPGRPGIKFLVWAGILIAVSLVGDKLIQPPKLIVYQQYRMMEAEGKLDWVVRAPVPFSPIDRSRDLRESNALKEPSAGRHWMGTDKYGADVASRMIHASRIALSIGFISTGIAIVIGVIIGGLMGFFSGVVDMLGMRLLEVFQSIPRLFLLLTFVAFFEPNLYLMMLILGLTGWPGYARFIRAEYLKLRQMDFVQAGVACGLPLHSILYRHMLPNGVAPVLVSASFGVAAAILAESTLSFLGLGLVEDPSWGQMLNQAVNAGNFTWWMATFPGLAIFLTVFAYNLIGESLRDAIDPHLKKVAG